MPKLVNLTEDEYAMGILKAAKIIEKKEAERKNPPTKQQIKRTLKILRQFCIYVDKDDVPEFHNMQELELWKHRMIKESNQNT